MRRFKFRLERLLSFRRSLTERERIRFAGKVGALVRTENQAVELRGIRNANLVARLRALGIGVAAQQVINLHEQILRIDEAIGQADQNIETAKEDVEKARGELVERMRDERAIEILRERRWERWLRDYYRDESKTLDDIATIRHVRKAE